MQHEGWCFHKCFGVSFPKPAAHHYPLSFCGTGEVILGTYYVFCGVLTVLNCVGGTSTVCARLSWVAVSDPRGKWWLHGACPPLSLILDLPLGKPGMETVGWGWGGRHGSKGAEEVLGRLLPSYWQDLVNVLPPRVAAQLTHTNLSPVHLLGRLRSQAVSNVGHKRFPAWGVRGAWLEDRGRKGGGDARVREEHEAGKRGGERRGLNVKLPLQRPAKSLSYMENTSRLQGNRTTSEFLQTKIALMSGYDPSVLWPSSLSVRLSHLNSHTRTEAHVQN